MMETLLRPEFLVAMVVIVGGALVALLIFRPQRSGGREPTTNSTAGMTPTGAPGWAAPAGPPHGAPGPPPGQWQSAGAQQPAWGQATQPPPAWGAPTGAGGGQAGPGGASATSDSDAQPGPGSQVPQATRPAITFDSVAGLDGPITELQEVAEYLRDPDRFRALGAELPKGILLHGPPGCGKTMLAKALAGEAGVAFHSVSATEFVEQYVGTGAKRVRSLFQDAEKNAPAIVFVDELDAIGRQRSEDNSGGHEFDHTLNQLLIELDGFLSHAGVVVIGATNRPELIDSALVRPGRFDRRVQLERPDPLGRQSILELHGGTRPVAEDVDWAAVAANTSGVSAAELANLVNEAALLAARRGHTAIMPDDVDEAETRVLSGTPNDRRPQKRDEWFRVAVHEAGHAALSLVLRGVKPPARVSIIDRAGGLASSPWEQQDDRRTLTTRQLRTRLILLFGGRAAELQAFGEPSTRAEDDLEQAADLARRMVERWAMTGRYELAGTTDGQRTPYVEGSAGAQEVRELLAWAEEAARTILAERDGLLLTIAEALAKKETLSARQLEELFQRSELPDDPGSLVEGERRRGLGADPAPADTEPVGGGPRPARAELPS